MRQAGVVVRVVDDRRAVRSRSRPEKAVDAGHHRLRLARGPDAVQLSYETLLTLHEEVHRASSRSPRAERGGFQLVGDRSVSGPEDHEPGRRTGGWPELVEIEQLLVVGRERQLVQRTVGRTAVPPDRGLRVEREVSVISATVEVRAHAHVGVVTDAIGELHAVAAEEALRGFSE